MKKNTKAIIAALSASIMCAVPVAASFASTAVTTSITAEAAADVIDTLAQPGNLANTNKGVANNGVVYECDLSNGTAAVEGRYTNCQTITSADKVKLNGRTYKVTSVKDGAFEGTVTVKYFNGGKYLERIGARAFRNSYLKSYTLKTNKPITFGDSSFQDAAISSITIPAGSVIENHAFRDNYYLREVNYYWNQEGDPNGTYYNSPLRITNNHTFYNCTRLERFSSNNRRLFYFTSDTFSSINNIYFSGLVF